MERIAKFSKVTLDQFVTDVASEKNGDITSAEILDATTVYDKIELPTRSTKDSAGYDIHTPFDVFLQPGETVKIPTGLRCLINRGWVLTVFPRSSVGFKYSVALCNTVGIIDGDYYNANNEGHIWIKLINHGDKPFHATAGDRICQGIFLPYGITSDDAVDTVRSGGIGSTGN